jgi:hypothetical protein
MIKVGHSYGPELELFAKAIQWKAYWGAIIKPYLGSRILDVGAGIGSTIQLLCSERQSLWLALEPNAHFAKRIRGASATGKIPAICEVRVGTLEVVEGHEQFDSILYIDVLEHIEDHYAEVNRASQHLHARGFLIVLAPAYQTLYTPFDKAVGHFRRYNRKALWDLTPHGLKVVRIDYLDSVGLLASLGNRVVLKSEMPTPAQIALWDRWMVPISRQLDPIFGYRWGKSILAIWEKL